VARQAARVADALDGGTVDEAGARGLARDTALLLQASLLHAHSPQAVFDSFCAARLHGAADVFGLLPSSLPLQALVQRSMPV
jgi:putative acyl-CoA dehydrogenase